MLVVGDQAPYEDAAVSFSLFIYFSSTMSLNGNLKVYMHVSTVLIFSDS